MQKLMPISYRWIESRLLAGISLAILSTLNASLLHAQGRPQAPVGTELAQRSSINVGSFEIKLPALEDSTSAPVVSALAASRDGRFIAAAGDDHAIRIIDAATGITQRTIVEHSDWIQTLVFSSDSQTLYSAGNDQRVLCWNHQYPLAPREIVRLPYAIRTLSLATQKQLLAIGGFSDEVLVWDLAAGRFKYRLDCDCGDQRCVRFSPDGNQLLTGGRDGEIRVWSMESGELTASYRGHSRRIHTAAFSTDGLRVTSVGEDRQLVQYDLQAKKVVLRREMAPSKLTSMCLINDHLAAVAGADNSVRLYDALAGQIIADLRGHFGTVAVMCPCGDFLASGSFDTTVRIWNLEHIGQRSMNNEKPVAHAPLKLDRNLQIR